MPPTIESPRDDSTTLAHGIRESVLCNSLSDLSDVQMRELDRRIAEDDADPDGGIPWDEVDVLIKAKYGV